MSMSISELETMTRPPKHSGMIPLRQVHEQRFPHEYPYSRLEDPRTTVMGPVRLPRGWTCHIHHADGRCDCQPPIIVSPGHLETAEASGLYVLGALHKLPVVGKLTQTDLDYLAWSCSKMCAHWARRALGQENLL